MSFTTAVPYRVLIVDDEVGLLRMFRTALSNYGHATEQARDGLDAMAQLKDGGFDVVVSDINMPGCGGLEFLRSVQDRAIDVPVVLMTGRPSAESSNRALEYGAFRVLTKPVMPATLCEVIRLAVTAHRAARPANQATPATGAPLTAEESIQELLAASVQVALSGQPGMAPAPVRWSEPAWRGWIDRVVRVHETFPALPLSTAVLRLVGEMRHARHWLFHTGAPPPDGSPDADICALQFLLIGERDPGELVRQQVQAAMMLMAHRDRLARWLLERVLTALPRLAVQH